jgi:hypothetical protein
MKGLVASVALAASIACSAMENGEYRSSGECRFGGTLVDCENAQRTVRDACWRLVDCGVIPLHDEQEENEFDWDACVNVLEDMPHDRSRVIVECVASSTCDELRTGLCLGFGDF